MVGDQELVRRLVRAEPGGKAAAELPHSTWREERREDEFGARSERKGQAPPLQVNWGVRGVSSFGGVSHTAGSELVLEDGAGFGDVGVQVLDDIVKLGLHDAAAKLQGEGEAPVVEGEVLRKQREALDGLVLRQVRGQT